MGHFLTFNHIYFEFRDSKFPSGKCIHGALLLAGFTIYQCALLEALGGVCR